MEDLHSYQVDVTDPWTFSLGDYQMYVPPPPTGGVLLGLVLNILKGWWVFMFKATDPTFSPWSGA